MDGASQDREALGIIQHLANALVEDGPGHLEVTSWWLDVWKDVDAQGNEDNHR